MTYRRIVGQPHRPICAMCHSSQSSFATQNLCTSIWVDPQQPKLVRSAVIFPAARFLGIQ